MTAHACVLHFSVSIQLDDEVGVLPRASAPEGALEAAAADMCSSDEDRSLFQRSSSLSWVKALVARCINVFTNIANGKYQRGKH